MAHLSDSNVQMVAEKLIIEGLERKLNIPSGTLQAKKIMFYDKVGIEIDGYSFEHRIMVEVFARIGKLAAAHFDKLANDILKLKIAEDILKVPYKKYIAVCGEDAERYLLGSSWKSFAVKYYNFEIIRIELSSDYREIILNTQKLQKEGMKL